MCQHISERVHLNQQLQAGKQNYENFVKEKEKEFSSRKEEINKAVLDKDKIISEKDEELKEIKEFVISSMGDLTQAKKELSDKDNQAKQLEDRLKESESATRAQAAEHAAQAAQLKNVMENLQKSLQSTINEYKAKLELAQKGLVVTVLGDILFTSGKADITPEGKAILDKICEVLNNVAAQNQIVMEGHTDNVPIKYSPWKSNWELSSARALSVAHYFIYERGFSPDRFTIHGYGEFRPTADNRTEAGRRQNRRVEIVIQPTKFTKVKLGEITSQPVTRPSLPKE